MKGLLYKDLLVLRKSLWTMLLLVAIFSVVPNGGYFNLGLFFVVYTGLLPVSLLAFDERSRWDRLAGMLPVTRREIVRSKYILGVCLSAAAGLLMFLGRLAVARLPLGEAAGMAVTAAALGVLFQAVLYPILFRLGVEKGRLAMGASVAVVVFLCLQARLLPGTVMDVGRGGLPAVGVPALIVLTAAAEAVSVRIAEKQYERRAG